MKKYKDGKNKMSNHLTKDTAVDKMMYCDRVSLRKLVQDEYQKIYGFRNLSFYKLTVPELVSWILYHYDFDETSQEWVLKENADIHTSNV